jgi:hypothetical protein
MLESFQLSKKWRGDMDLTKKVSINRDEETIIGYSVFTRDITMKK